MGNQNSGQNQFSVQRIIAYKPTKIIIGICINNENNINVFKQCIAIDDELIPNQLISCTENKIMLCYKFDNDIKLNFMKHKTQILYHIESKNVSISKFMDDDLRQQFKEIKFYSTELDKIFNFIKQENNIINLPKIL
jgi:hypothetical protein